MDNDTLTSVAKKELKSQLDVFLKYNIERIEGLESSAAFALHTSTSKYFNRAVSNSKTIVTNDPEELEITVLVLATSTDNPDYTDPITNWLSVGNVAIISGIVILLCILLAGALLGYWAKKRKRPKKVIRHEKRGEGEETDQLIYFKTFEEVCKLHSIPIYTSDELKLMGKIGIGSFGEVYKGELNDKQVAVKKARSESSTFVIQEVEAMGSLSHPNILSLIGIVSNWESPGLIFDFMEYGDLQQILRDSNPTSQHTYPPLLGISDNKEIQVEGEGQNIGKISKYLLTHDKLDIVAWHIADGMKYLSSKRLVHRDLATRNCLVSSKGEVKIADFGLSRHINDKDYYKIPGWNPLTGTNRKLPFRWLAPESLRLGCFTVESDVWAYGIVLVEIYSWGSVPYCGCSDEETVNLITGGIPPQIPAECPSPMEEIIKECLINEPKCRLTFHQICGKFETSTQHQRASTLSGVKTDPSGYLVPT